MSQNCRSICVDLFKLSKDNESATTSTKSTTKSSTTTKQTILNVIDVIWFVCKTQSIAFYWICVCNSEHRKSTRERQRGRERQRANEKKNPTKWPLNDSRWLLTKIMQYKSNGGFYLLFIANVQLFSRLSKWIVYRQSSSSSSSKHSNHLKYNRKVLPYIRDKWLSSRGFFSCLSLSLSVAFACFSLCLRTHRTQIRSFQ